MDEHALNELKQELAAAHEDYAVAELHKDVELMDRNQNRILGIMARIEDMISAHQFSIGNE